MGDQWWRVAKTTSRVGSHTYTHTLNTWHISGKLGIIFSSVSDQSFSCKKFLISKIIIFFFSHEVGDKPRTPCFGGGGLSQVFFIAYCLAVSPLPQKITMLPLPKVGENSLLSSVLPETGTTLPLPIPQGWLKCYYPHGMIIWGKSSYMNRN